MKVLIVGGGGREHALVKAVARSAHHPEILCAPGNGGTEMLAENVAVAAEDVEGLCKLARDRAIDLTVVGPEVPLCAGIVDRFEASGLRIFGPSRSAARLEGDKAYAKKLLAEARIPTAIGRSFDRYEYAREYIATRDSAQVVKAAGLAAGKGVVVCDDPSDALIEAERMMVEGKFGEAGRCIVVEEKLEGEELSIHAIIDGRSVYVLDASQDHKRLWDGDTGSNTGGMGAYSPAPRADAAVMSMVESEVLVPILDCLHRHDVDYRGVLYCGLMITHAGPKVLEFNCRFGDPESQVLLPRLKTDFVDIAQACIDGKLDGCEIEWDPRPAVCVVLASGGYPGTCEVGKPIEGIIEAGALENVTIQHAGTLREHDGWVTDGGRVLSVTALGDTLAQAHDRAYEAVKLISFEGMQYRTDIAHRALGSNVS